MAVTVITKSRVGFSTALVAFLAMGGSEVLTRTRISVRDEALVCGAFALAGLISKGISAATTPQADTRSWDNLPRYISFANLELAPGQHVITVDFRNGNGAVLSNLTKTLTVDVPADGKDKVIFVSDQSLTPQTL